MRLLFLALFCSLLSVTSASSQTVDQGQALHLLNRITYGPSPYMMAQVKRMGLGAFIEQQLHPEGIPPLPGLDQALAKYPTANMPLIQLTEEYLPEEQKGKTPDEKKAARERAKIVSEEMRQEKMLRAVYSPAQLQELMVDFWFNHFNVFEDKGADRVLIGAYERDAIRPYALGKFKDLLEATAHHPAMLFYLDNWLNTDPNSRFAKGKFNGINENYAREIMELHTMGVDGGYSQQDVTTLARVLTGWGFATGGGKDKAEKMAEFYFDPHRHDFSDKLFLGQTIYGRGADEVEQAIDILVGQPSTAHHISYQIAQYFVADQPPESLVNAMTQTFTKTNGDIRAVLSTMLYSKEFWDPQNAQNKFKTPLRYVVSAVRLSSGANTPDALQKTIRNMGEPIYGCLTPDGYPNTNERWLNSDALLKRIDFARRLVNGKLDKDDNTATALDPKTATNSMLGVFGSQFYASYKVVNDAEPKLRPVLILASPEFLYY